MTDPASPSRLERLRHLLDDASAGAHAGYQGLGAFWHLPLEKLLGAELYGVRLIAPAAADGGLPGDRPAATPSCCHPPAPPPA
jgi:hypothetical protein